MNPSVSRAAKKVVVVVVIVVVVVVIVGSSSMYMSLMWWAPKIDATRMDGTKSSSIRTMLSNSFKRLYVYLVWGLARTVVFKTSVCSTIQYNTIQSKWECGVAQSSVRCCYARWNQNKSQFLKLLNNHTYIITTLFNSIARQHTNKLHANKKQHRGAKRAKRERKKEKNRFGLLISVKVRFAWTAVQYIILYQY